MIIESTVDIAAPARDIITTLIKRGDLGDCVLYEQEQSIYLAACPLWELTVDISQAEPWEYIAQSIADNGFSDHAVYGWVGFELASHQHGKTHLDRRTDEPAAQAAGIVAKFFVPAVEICCKNGEVHIRSTDSDRIAWLRDIILATAPYEPALAQELDITGVDADYLDAVAAAVSEIESGQLQKVILSRVVEAPFEVDIFDTYLRGRAANTPARSFYLHLNDWEVAGFCPETVAELSATGELSTQPLAGTRALTGDEQEDERLRLELLQDPKEIFEHAASVKLACDELSEVADDEGVWVSEFMVIKSRGSVQHLGSRVNCQLASDKTRWDALKALFPAITASGIPKAAAYKVIYEQEKTARLLYSGAIIRCDPDGSLDAALVLRSVYQLAGRAWLRAGAGIVAGSQPAREHEETREKLSSVAPYLVPLRGQ